MTKKDRDIQRVQNSDLIPKEVARIYKRDYERLVGEMEQSSNEKSFVITDSLKDRLRDSLNSFDVNSISFSY